MGIKSLISGAKAQRAERKHARAEQRSAASGAAAAPAVAPEEAVSRRRLRLLRETRGRSLLGRQFAQQAEAAPAAASAQGLDPAPFQRDDMGHGHVDLDAARMGLDHAAVQQHYEHRENVTHTDLDIAQIMQGPAEGSVPILHHAQPTAAAALPSASSRSDPHLLAAAAAALKQPLAAPACAPATSSRDTGSVGSASLSSRYEDPPLGLGIRSTSPPTLRIQIDSVSDAEQTASSLIGSSLSTPAPSPLSDASASKASKQATQGYSNP
jgi:hypothetical protein